MARMLLAEFRTLRRTLTASARRITRVVDDTCALALLRLYRAALIEVLKPEPARTSVTDSRELIAYLSLVMGSEPVECIRLLHLDARRRLIHEDEWCRGSVDEAPAYIREIIHRALDMGAAGLLIVHNHPSGDPVPSRTDVELTRRLVAAANAVGIAVHDHVVVSNSGYVSIRELHGL